jgi:hypothetical protein
MHYLHKPRWSHEDRGAIGRPLLTVLGVQVACLVAVLTIAWIANGKMAAPAATVSAQASPAR